MLSVFVALLAAAALCVGVWAGVTDFKGLKIPNIISIVIVCLFAFYFVTGLFSGIFIFNMAYTHVMAAVAVFAVTFSLFAFGLLGGGDAKMLSAYALWTGVGGLVSMLFWMSVVGGVLAMIGIFIRRVKPFHSMARIGLPQGCWIDRLQQGHSAIPYGIAITIGAIVSFVRQGFLDPLLIFAG